jgi:hypothetical protein
MVIVLIIASLMAAPAPESRPVVSRNTSGIDVVLPVAVLSQKAVQQQLQSGLTTTFLVTVRDRSWRDAWASRMEIRFDLWEETYIVRRLERGMKPASAVLRSRAELETWWKNAYSIQRPATSVDVELKVLPFSAAEESDARQWLSKSGGIADPDARTNSIVDALIGTTLSARPLASFRWSVPVR